MIDVNRVVSKYCTGSVEKYALGELKKGTKCRKCGDPVIMVAHLWGHDKATFEYVHDQRSDGYRKRPCVMETTASEGESWLEEETEKK